MAYAERMGVRYTSVAIRCQKTLWGSCNSKGALSFNCLLMLISDEIQDYVVVHELAHIRYMNHQKEFWGVVESVLPDYKERRKRLKEEGAVARQRFLAMK